jgi:CTP:phosphocholine cytidylyltransferase-like protein
MPETELSRSQFDILTALEEESRTGPAAEPVTPPTQRALARETGLSVGTVNKTLARLAETRLVDKNRITALGLKTLEPYRAQRAVFFAAGFSGRLLPVTLSTPKALIRVNGRRIIDTLLDAVIAAGINDIIIVRCYRGQQFSELLTDYPMIQFRENPRYNESNSIASALCVRSHLRNCYVLEADLILRSPRLITRYQYCSNYLGVPVDVTDDWCLESRNGVVTKIRVGGRNCHQMVGISYWSGPDGAKLADHIKQVYEMPGGKERCWDQVALEYFARDYEIAIRECTFADITEVDTYTELQRLDQSYCAVTL